MPNVIRKQGNIAALEKTLNSLKFSEQKLANHVAIAHTRFLNIKFTYIEDGLLMEFLAIKMPILIGVIQIINLSLFIMESLQITERLKRDL